MTKIKATKKAADLIRQGKNLSSLLTVYERMHNGELVCTPEGIKALEYSILGATNNIIQAISN